jgi:hypothetical protein
MDDTIMGGLWRYMLKIPPFIWRRKLTGGKRDEELGFMTGEHRLVHHFIVRELPGIGEPISPDFVADTLAISRDRVATIFDDLEEHMTFICRNDEGMAVWAYPVTVERTPHHLTFSTGEQIYAA